MVALGVTAMFGGEPPRTGRTQDTGGEKRAAHR